MKIIDMHCDTIGEIYYDWKKGKKTSLSSNDYHIDLAKMKQGGYLLQNFALFVDQEKTDDPYRTCKEMISCYEQLMKENEEEIAPVYCFEDISKNECEGRLSGLLTVEGGEAIAGNLDHLDEFYEKGVRMMTLTWNYKNQIGYPNSDLKNPAHIDTENGLTPFGFDLVKYMEQKKMIIDVSHGSDRLFYDVLASTNKPFVASHSNARSLCGHGRNLTDEMVRKLSERGGVIGVNFFPYFLVDGEQPFGSVERIIAHMQHLYQVGGIDCVGLGTDFDGIPRENLELENASYMPKLLQQMQKAGFHESEVDKITGENVLRLYKECL
ncbi:microsomal dipeptidase [Lachnospiraceae bacterium KM106-2]|nr:microsomal dipeptidase [Lachnospiraceae bacterium KM106-2]